MMRSSPSSSSSLSSSPLGVTAQKRRIRERDLWDVIVNNDDITFNHILPRLNSTDVKFLYEVNSETRKLIKRSSRKRELRKTFKVEEMSSISTLEFVWENKPLRSDYWSESYFCLEVAKTNKLEFLKWAREEKKCEWDSGTINRAAHHGNLEMVKYCVANECPFNEWACTRAAQNGHLEVLKYLHEEAKAPLECWTAAGAARNGHLHILEYLVERKYDRYEVHACKHAAANGHLDCLKYLHETAKAPWDEWSVLPSSSSSSKKGNNFKRGFRLSSSSSSEQQQEQPAKIQETYQFHSPGGKVTFAHETDAEKSKWTNCEISHVGDVNEETKVKLGIVIGEFHDQLMNRMLEDARLSALAMNAEITRVVFVPGTYEAPLILENMLMDDSLDAACVLGYIEKGSTLHGEEMGNTCSLIFKQLELEYRKPVGMGIIGPGATAEQAETRVAYAGNAIRAAIRMARTMMV
ncbi:unnamed protein product [Bathycoccus prasinos]